MSQGRKAPESPFPRRRATWGALISLMAALGPLAIIQGCGEAQEIAVAPAAPNPAPNTARMDQVRDFQADLAAVRHPGDGGGTAQVTAAPDRVVAGAPGRWTIEYTVGEHGVAAGGVITLMPEPFWGWSTPQAERRDFPGFTDVSLHAAEAAAELETATFGGAEAGMLLLTVKGAALVPGDTVILTYGAGERGARADRYAGRNARIWLGVDADGDGVRSLVESSPSIDVEAREPARAVLLGPSIARPGERLRYSISALDEWANAAPINAPQDGSAPSPWTPTVSISGYPEDWEGPSSVALGPDGSADFEVLAGAASATPLRLIANVPLPGDETARAESNPLWLDGTATPILWADLHGHTGLSDGTGAVDDYFRYARDVARLDVIALTDHDHFGMEFLDAQAEHWDEIQRINREYHAQGAFVTILGYEWTSWIHGHRHVLYFDGQGEVLSSITAPGLAAYDTPAKLWQGLRGQRALTIAHHSSGNPVPVNWSYPPDPELEPVTEIVSVHGSSEARDAPQVVAGSRDGQFVRDQLDLGRKLGFIGSGDSHDGHPGLAHLSPGYGWRPATARRGALSGTGGLAAIRAESLTREAIYRALRARKTYATSGPRIAIRETIDGDARTVSAAGTAPFRSAEWIVGAPDAGRRPIALGETPSREFATTLTQNEVKAHAYVYLRLVQHGGGTAWYGPFWGPTR